MKGRRWVCLSFLALALIVWGGCVQRNGERAEAERTAGAIERAAEQAAEEAERLAANVRAEISDFRDRMSRNLGDYETSLKDLESRLEKRKDAAGEQLRKEIAGLRQEKQQFMDRLEGLKDGPENWTQMREDLNRTWEQLQERMGDLKERILQ